MEKSNYKINWNLLNEKEANDILLLLNAKFNLIGRSFEGKEFDIANIYCKGEYDDNFHADLMGQLDERTKNWIQKSQL